MLPTEERLKKNKLIRLALKNGQRAYSPYFSLHFLANQQNKFRAAVICALKVSKKATERNLIRRRIYAVLTDFKTKRDLRGDFVIIAKKEILDADFSLIKKEMNQCLKKLSSGSSISIKRPSRQITG